MDMKEEILGLCYISCGYRGKYEKQGVVEGAVSAQSGEGWGWEDASSNGIVLNVSGMSANDVLNAEGGGVKGEIQGNSPCCVWGRGSRTTGDAVDGLMFRGQAAQWTCSYNLCSTNPHLSS